MINICYALSDKEGTYSKFLGTSLWSLLQHHSAHDLHIHLLHDETLTEQERRRFQQVVVPFQQKISFYNMKRLAMLELEFLHQKLPRVGLSRYTYGAFYRLFAAKFLPEEVTRFIYLDADTVVNMDIAFLWNVSLDGHPMAAVSDCDNTGRPAENPLVMFGGVDGCDYFSSGVLLVDRQKFLAVGDILQDGIRKLKEIPGFAFYDQDILNLFYSKDYLHLDIAYNAYVPVLQMRGVQQLASAIYHYEAGSLGIREDDVYDRLFYTVFAQTPWCDADFLYRFFAQLETQHKHDLHLARQVFAMGSRRQRIFCANEASKAAITELFDFDGDDKYLAIQGKQDWTGRLLQYELVSPKGNRLYILFLQHYEDVSQALTAAGWQEGLDFMDGWSLLPTECGGHLFLRPELIRNL